MKKFNKNSLLFVFFIVFVVAGLLGGCLGQLKGETASLISNLLQGNWSYIFSFKDNVDTISSKELSYHGALMDINSAKDNILGAKVSVEKGVAKSESDSLIVETNKMSQEDIHNTVSKISKLKDAAQSAGADFLYFAIPDKGYYETAPENISNFEKQNYDEFINQLAAEDVPYLDFAEYLNQSNVANGQDVYYKTDHHWRTYYGFLAANQISHELNSRYNIPLTAKYTDINNYNVESYPDWFLGSYGKKVGTYFTWGGADDFELITPAFDTDFSEKISLTGEVKNGSFDDIMLKKSNLSKDFYSLSPYNAYMATNKQRVRVIENNCAENNGKRVLIVQTSFSQVTTPFLALQNKETYICDLRIDQGIEEAEIDLKEYIAQIKPDAVVVIYNSVYDAEMADGRYDFFNEQ